MAAITNSGSLTFVGAGCFVANDIIQINGQVQKNIKKKSKGLSYLTREKQISIYYSYFIYLLITYLSSTLADPNTSSPPDLPLAHRHNCANK